MGHDMTPDELRGVMGKWLAVDKMTLADMASLIDAAADAWQLSDALASKALITLGQKQDEIDALRQRLEAAGTGKE